MALAISASSSVMPLEDDVVSVGKTNVKGLLPLPIVGSGSGGVSVDNIEITVSIFPPKN